MKKIILFLFCVTIFSSCEREDLTTQNKPESTAKKLVSTDLAAYPCQTPEYLSYCIGTWNVRLGS